MGNAELVARATLNSNQFMNVGNQTSRQASPPPETVEVDEKKEVQMEKVERKQHKSDIHQIEMPPRGGRDDSPPKDPYPLKAASKPPESSQISLSKLKTEKKKQSKLEMRKEPTPSEHIVHNSLIRKNRRPLPFKAIKGTKSPSRRSTGNITTEPQHTAESGGEIRHSSRLMDTLQKPAQLPIVPNARRTRLSMNEIRPEEWK